MPGIHDSSITRVAPVFEALEEGGHLPGSLGELLSLPSRDGQDARAWGDPGEPEETAWWPKEKRLDPPRALLQYLVRHLSTEGKRASTVPNRDKLLAGDEAALAAALRALGEETVPPRAWYVFEGRTSVDAYVRTSRFVVLVEGKRTEPGPTTHTSWMDVRHQVLRNLDAAWDSRGEREVVAFFAVEGNATDDTSVPEHWMQAVDATLSEEALAGSLPHRGEDERQEMARAFRGAVTWQAICDEFSLPRNILIDEVPPELRTR
jgi:hypothetical protein